MGLTLPGVSRTPKVKQRAPSPSHAAAVGPTARASRAVRSASTSIRAVPTTALVSGLSWPRFSEQNDLSAVALAKEEAVVSERGTSGD